MVSHDYGMPAKSSRDPVRFPGTRCLISSKAHIVSESNPPVNYKNMAKKCDNSMYDEISAYSLST